MPSSILARADALMRRRRQTPEAEDVPVLTEALEEDDIPLLLNAEPPPGPSVASANAPSEPLPAGNCNLPDTAPVAPETRILASESVAPQGSSPATDTIERERLVADLTRRIERRLADELPRLIEETVRAVLAEQEMDAHRQSRG